MLISAAVTTAPRDASYLPDTLQSLAAAGFDSPLVVCDGQPKLGPKATFRRALWSLRGAEWLAIFQDDIVVARGLRDWLEQHVLGTGVYSLYCSTVHDGKDGWRQVDLVPNAGNTLPWHNSLGACALLLHETVASGFLKDDPQFNRNDRIGAAVGEYCYRNDLPFFVHCPSLVQHIGEVSCRHGAPVTPERRAARFCDDVRSLSGAAGVSPALSPA